MLLKLEKTTGRKIVRGALRKGSKVIQTAAKENARTMVGGEMGALIAKNIVVRALKKCRRGSFVINVQIRAVDEFMHVTRTGKRYFIPAAIEAGHDNVAPVPFMRNAHAVHEHSARQVVVSEINKGIERQARK